MDIYIYIYVNVSDCYHYVLCSWGTEVGQEC